MKCDKCGHDEYPWMSWVNEETGKHSCNSCEIKRGNPYAREQKIAIIKAEAKALVEMNQ